MKCKNCEWDDSDGGRHTADHCVRVLMGKLGTLEARAERARDFFSRYPLWHLRSCAIELDRKSACTCGLTGALAALNGGES